MVKARLLSLKTTYVDLEGGDLWQQVFQMVNQAIIKNGWTQELAPFSEMLNRESAAIKRKHNDKLNSRSRTRFWRRYRYWIIVFLYCHCYFHL